MSTEQRTHLKFLVRLGKTPSEALGFLQQVYGDETMSHSGVFERCKRFTEGRQDVEDDPGEESLRRAGSNVEQMLDVNRDNVTEDLGMRKVCAMVVPKLLKDDQKDRRMQVCQDILECLETEPDLPVMSHGSSSTTRRPNTRALRGRVRRRQGRRNQDTPSPKPKSR
nr:PREDICTED: putative uncharacterized protein FLJ37770 [Stegastes partitus]